MIFKQRLNYLENDEVKYLDPIMMRTTQKHLQDHPLFTNINYH